MLRDSVKDTLCQLARGIAAQFGSNCEVVLHEISERSATQSIVAIENGHVSGRKLGDGPSRVVLEQLSKQDAPEDHLCYLTRTPDGKLLKSTSIYIRDDAGKVAAIFGINFDISTLAMAEHALAGLISTEPAEREDPARITNNVNDLLDALIAQADRLVGKPVAMMTKEDKVRAIRFLDDHGALLITKSGDKIANHFGISKYTLYSYLDVKTGGKNYD